MVAARAATRVAVTKAAVARVAGVVAPRAVVARVVVATVVSAVFGAFQSEQLAENWALAAWEAVEMAAAAWVAGGTMADWVAGRGGGVSHSRRSRSQSRNSCLTRTSPHPGRLCRRPCRRCRGRSLAARARAAAATATAAEVRGTAAAARLAARGSVAAMVLEAQ